MVAVLSEFIVDHVRNCFLVETSSKQTRFNFGCKSFFILKKHSGYSALASLEARIGLVDYIEATLAPHNLAVGVTVLKCLDGRYNFHF